MMRRNWMRFAILVSATIFSAGFALAQSAGQTKTAALSGINIKYEKYTLPNGLDVILSEDHRLPMVAVNIWYHVGPANELPGRDSRICLST
jgi:zinc protease